MNRLRSAAVSKTNRSASQRLGLLRLVPLLPRTQPRSVSQSVHGPS
jgi:hypothetical protein